MSNAKLVLPDCMMGQSGPCHGYLAAQRELSAAMAELAKAHDHYQPQIDEGIKEHNELRRELAAARDAYKALAKLYNVSADVAAHAAPEPRTRPDDCIIYLDMAEGSIYWHGREVLTDDDFKSCMKEWAGTNLMIGTSPPAPEED